MSKGYNFDYFVEKPSEDKRTGELYSTIERPGEYYVQKNNPLLGLKESNYKIKIKTLFEEFKLNKDDFKANPDSVFLKIKKNFFDVNKETLVVIFILIAVTLGYSSAVIFTTIKKNMES